jgi:hypothetical protein
MMLEKETICFHSCDSERLISQVKSLSKAYFHSNKKMVSFKRKRRRKLRSKFPTEQSEYIIWAPMGYIVIKIWFPITKIAQIFFGSS